MVRRHVSHRLTWASRRSTPAGPSSPRLKARRAVSDGQEEASPQSPTLLYNTSTRVDPELRDEADSRHAALVRLVSRNRARGVPNGLVAEATLAQCLLTPDEEVSSELVKSNARGHVSGGRLWRGRSGRAVIARKRAFARDPGLRGADRCGPDFAAEVAQTVRQKLLVSPAPGQPGKIAEYRGAGPLGGWIRVIAVRVALDLKRAQSSPGRADSDADRPRRRWRGDPEIALLRDLYRDAFRNALHAALAELSGRERNLLRFHFADGLTLDELATSYRVHRATIARWLARRGGTSSNARASNWRSRWAPRVPRWTASFACSEASSTSV